MAGGERCTMQFMHACIRNALAHSLLATSEQHIQRHASRLVQRQKRSGRPRNQDSRTTRCFARWPSLSGPRKTPSLCRACQMRKKGAGRALRVRAADRDTRALQSVVPSHLCWFVKEERMVKDVGCSTDQLSLPRTRLRIPGRREGS